MKPKEVSDTLMVFPAGQKLRALIPPEALLARVEKDETLRPYRSLFNTTVLTAGEAIMEIQWADGIDSALALRHLATVTRTMDIKHEVKESAWSILMRDWTTYIKYRCFRSGVTEIGVKA